MDADGTDETRASTVSDTYTVYGVERSLFTRKLTAALDFYGAPYTVAARTPFIQDTLLVRANTNQIPLIHTPDDWVLADTTPILRLLDSRFPGRRLFPEGPLGVLVNVVEEVLDEWVARVMVHYRWHYTENALHVLSQRAGRKVTLEEAQSIPVFQWGPRACRATGTEHPAQQQAAEREYLSMLDALEAQLASTRFALGDRPSAVDTMILGGLRAHTNADPIPDLSGYERILAWEEHCRQGWDGQGVLAPFPQSTPFAQHMLNLARQEYIKFVNANGRALLNNMRAFEIETYGERTSYMAREYPERSRRHLRAYAVDTLNERERGQVMEWLETEGLKDMVFASHEQTGSR